MRGALNFALRLFFKQKKIIAMRKYSLLFIFLFCCGYVQAQNMSVTYKELNVSTRGIGYVITAKYPQVEFGPEALMGLRGIAEDINHMLDTLVNGMVRRFEIDTKDFPITGYESHGSTLDITSDAFISGGSLLSVPVTSFSYFSGAAHPMTIITTFNYSTLIYGELNSPGKLFKSDFDYLGYLSGKCIASLKQYAKEVGADGNDDMINEGASPSEENFRNWYIENDSLIIVFNPYQAGPYVMGVQTVSIPLSEMLDMLDPKGPLEFLYR